MQTTEQARANLETARALLGRRRPHASVGSSPLGGIDERWMKEP
ncbi:hypothetical protein [Pseudomonas tohonis]|nr:hypothetical protein [Pseudomonas tohonis]UXY55505.1 hypothetical protein N9L84_13330 [Pseudomonas tohonis]